MTVIRFHDETHCPGCGRSGVVVSLNSVLLEVRPEVRPHVCGLGGPGSAAGSGESLEESVRAVLAGNGGTMGAVADGLAAMGLGKSTGGAS